MEGYDLLRDAQIHVDTARYIGIVLLLVFGLIVTNEVE